MDGDPSNRELEAEAEQLRMKFSAARVKATPPPTSSLSMLQTSRLLWPTKVTSSTPSDTDEPGIEDCTFVSHSTGLSKLLIVVSPAKTLWPSS